MPRLLRSRLVAVTAVVALSATACSQDVAAEDVEQSIATAVEEKGVTLESADCPRALPPEADAEMICQVELDGPIDGVEVDRIRVIVNEVEGREVRYRLEPLAVGAPDDAQPGETVEPTPTEEPTEGPETTQEP